MMVILNVPDDGYSERIWWWLFWAYLMMVILNVPDEGYSEHTWWRLFWAYLMKVILSIPDEGYSRNVPDDGYSERTWWRLFQKLVVRTKLDIYLFIIERKLKQLWLTILSTKRTIISHLNSLIIIKNYGIKIGHPGSDLVQAQKCGEVKPVNVLLSFEKKIWKANLDDVF